MLKFKYSLHQNQKKLNMPTFRQDTKICGMVPMMKTDDINDQAITKDKIRDGNVTAEKLADGAVSTDKLPDGAIKTPKIADENITTSKLAEASVVTSKIADQNVTKEKIADHSVDNSKLSPEAVTYDKLKDKAIITEKLNDRAVTTEKVEEKAITNTKLGDQSVDGRVVREASIEEKHLGNNAVSTSKIASRSVTNEKIAQNSVSRAELTPDVRSSIDKKADAEQVNNSLYDLEKKIGDRFVVEGDVTNLPDEEDLTSVKESERDVLKLADRSYAPEKFSGKGYKILRRNIKSVSIAVTKVQIESAPSTDGTLSFSINGKETHISVSASTDNTTALVAQKVASAFQESMTEYEVSKDASTITLTRKFGGEVSVSSFSAVNTGVSCTITDSTKKELRNIITQDMINQANTIYVIRYDFTFGEDITVPANCILKFNGGSISGAYTIIGNNTGINAGFVKIFNTDITIAGTWSVAEAYPEWFGAVGDLNVTDDTVAIQKTIDFAEARGNGKGKVKLSKGHRINNTITIRNCSFDGGGNDLHYYGDSTAISLIGNHYMTTIENFVLVNSGGEGLNGIKNENEGADTGSGLNNAWIRHITVYSFKEYGFHFRNAWLCNLEGLRAESCKNTNNDAVGLYVDRAYNSKLYNINAEDNNIGISLYCLSTSFRGVCVDKCTHIGIAASYVVGCSIEDVHFECSNENVSGIKIFGGTSNTFKNIFMSTTKTGFKAFDFSGLGEDVYSYGHIFQDLHFNLQSDSITFALHTTSISYPRVYDCTVLNQITYEDHGILYTGNGYIRFLNTSNTTGHNKDILVEVNNGSPRIIPSSSEQISNNFAIISDCASIHGDGNTKNIYDLSRSFIGFIFVYTNKAFAIYSNIANDVNVPNLIFTSDNNVFNTTDGIRWSTTYSTTYTLIISSTFGTSDIINVELKELKFT